MKDEGRIYGKHCYHRPIKRRCQFGWRRTSNSNFGIFPQRFHESGVLPVAILAESSKLKAESINNE
jgi:hypothetical protein